MSEAAAFFAPVPWVEFPARIAVLLSGRGSNFEALAAACRDGRLPAEIVVAISDRPGAAGLEHARARGIHAVGIPRSDFPGQAEHEAALEAALSDSRAELVCLAGYMRVLSPTFCARRPLRILNIHPSLLPSFTGLEAQQQALEWGVRTTGATVHFVDAGLDSGPIVDQVVVCVEEGDDTESLSARILEAEHALYVRSLARLLKGGWQLAGRRILYPAGDPKSLF